MSDSVTQWMAAHQASLSFTVSWSLLRLGVHWVKDAVILFAPFISSCQSFSASGSFPVSHLFASSGQVLELQHQSFQWVFTMISFRTDLIHLLSRKLSRVFSSTTFWKHQFFGAQPSSWFYLNVENPIIKK